MLSERMQKTIAEKETGSMFHMRGSPLVHRIAEKCEYFGEVSSLLSYSVAERLQTEKYVSSPVGDELGHAVFVSRSTVFYEPFENLFEPFIDAGQYPHLVSYNLRIQEGKWVFETEKEHSVEKRVRDKG